MKEVIGVLHDSTIYYSKVADWNTLIITSQNHRSNKWLKDFTYQVYDEFTTISWD